MLALEQNLTTINILNIHLEIMIKINISLKNFKRQTWGLKNAEI